MQKRSQRDNSGYLSEDTIAALATAVGGAVALVRVSGPASLEILEKIAGIPCSPNPPAARKLTRAILRNGQGIAIDDALVVYFQSPKSFTGEDLLELHIHGGSFVATRVLETLLELGARQALPGEFSFRAVRNGKMTVSQAQATADLIGASNEGAVSLALEKMAGTQNALIRQVAEELRTLAMLGEVGIDFADQDIEEVSLPRLKKRITPIEERLRHLEGSYSRGSRLQEGIGVAFMGLPNAGKSSFFNALLGEDRSIVSEVAGTTRDVVREKLTLRGKSASVTLRLEDTAGLRDADETVEKMGIERTQKAVRAADLLLLVVDGASSVDDLLVLRDQWLKVGARSECTLGMISKRDIVGAEQLNALRSQLGHFGIRTWIETSAKTGQGISEAAETIADFSEKWVHRDQGEVLLTRLDQVQAVAEALTHLERASGVLEIDLFASDLRQALNVLSPMIGETPPDDILGRIFSSFCIGK